MTQLAFSDVHNSIRLSAHHRVSHPFCARVASPRSRLTQAQCSVTVQSSQFITAARTDPGGQAKLLLSRRGALAAAAAALALPALTPRVAAADTGDLLEFRNSQQGYRIERPAAWSQTSKAGADVLFEDPVRKSSTLGVTVNPIRMDSLEAFGDLDAVASRLLQAEKAKESTTGVQLIRQMVRKGAVSGVTVYDFEYVLDSTRGRKLILNTVAIFGRRLYIVNGTAKCEGGACGGAAEEAAAIMRGATATFDTL